MARQRLPPNDPLQWHVADVNKASNYIGLLVRDVQANGKATGAEGVEEVL